jgi:hypothetical protein
MLVLLLGLVTKKSKMFLLWQQEAHVFPSHCNSEIHNYFAAAIGSTNNCSLHKQETHVHPLLLLLLLLTCCKKFEWHVKQQQEANVVAWLQLTINVLSNWMLLLMLVLLLGLVTKKIENVFAVAARSTRLSLVLQQWNSQLFCCTRNTCASIVAVAVAASVLLKNSNGLHDNNKNHMCIQWCAWQHTCC